MKKFKLFAHLSVVVCVTVFVFVFASDAFAGTCTISSNVTQTQSELETCGGGSLTDLVVDSGYTLTLSEPITVTNSVTVNGTINHVAADADGVDITAASMAISGTGSLNVNGLGCGAGVGGDGQGPNGSNVCSVGGDGSSPSAGYQASGGAGHGGAGGAGTGGAGGSFYGSATNPVLFGAGTGSTAWGNGEPGGGLVKLNISGNMTHAGTIFADGDDAANRGNPPGGAAGGSINITVGGTLTGSGTYSAKGGDGDADGSKESGGGGGGRIAITFNGGASYTSSDFDVSGGDRPNDDIDGQDGTVFVKDASSNTGVVFHGFTYDDTDFDTGITTWVMDSSATEQQCTSGTSPVFDDVTTLNIAGAINCSGISGFTFGASNINLQTGASITADSNVSINATVDLSVDSGVGITITGTGNDLDMTIPNGIDQTWTNVTVTLPEEGIFTMDDEVDLDLAGTTALNTNVQFTALTGFAIDATASINADGKGCRSVQNGADGYGPNGSNVCGTGGGEYGYTTGQIYSGRGGAGHGGAGGTGYGNGGAGGATYDTAAAPVLFGASGGSSNQTTNSGAGGGVVRLNISGNAEWNGAISAEGGDAYDTGSNRAHGGGSGGSVYITVSGILSGTTGTLSVMGGDGSDGNGSIEGGGGGGGLAAVEYATNSSSFFAGLVSAGVAPGGDGGPTGATDTADDGSTGVFTPIQLLVLNYGKYKDINTDGQVDQVDLVFNKNITLDECEVADYSFGGVDAGAIVVSSCSAATNILELTIANAIAGDTDLSFTISYDASNGTANSIHDGAGSNLSDVSGETLNDAAAPVIIALTPANGSDDVSTTTNLVMTFSESVNIGSGNIEVKVNSDDSEFETIDVTGGQVSAGGSDTITVNPSGEFDGGEEYYVLINATAFDDAATNDFAGIVSKTAWVFTAENTAGYETDDPVATIVLLNPTGGEVVVSGNIESITWTTTNYSSSSDVGLYISYDAGATYDLIDTVLASETSYDWEVPEEETSSAFVRASLEDAADETFDSSDYAFSISVAESPGGGGGSSTEDVVEEEVDEIENEGEAGEPSEAEGSGLFDLPIEAESPHTGFMQGVAQGLEPGDMITGETTKVVYYLDEQGKRRPFPTLQIFLTWADGFDDVRLVSDATLSLIPLGAPMLPKPGVVLVKIPSVPHVYVVETSEDADRAVIRHIPDEETAIGLFGDDWADYVIDVDLTLFSRFDLGEEFGVGEEVDPIVMKRRIELVLD